jgi:hypothetical protein
MLSNLCAGPSQMRGGAMACAWKHIWLLIFFVLFASSASSRKAGAKRTKEKLGANTFEVLVSYGEPNKLIQ